MFACFGFGGLDHLGEFAGLHLVGLGQHDTVTHRCLVEHFHHLAVDILGAVAPVDQHQRARQYGPAAQIGLHETLPLLDHFHRRLGKAVAGHVDETEQRGFAHFEEVEFLRAARRDRSTRDRLAPGQRIEQRALAHVRASAEGDLGYGGFGQELELRRRKEEIHPAREQLARAPFERGPLGSFFGAHDPAFAASAALRAFSSSIEARSCGCFE